MKDMTCSADATSEMSRMSSTLTELTKHEIHQERKMCKTVCWAGATGLQLRQGLTAQDLCNRLHHKYLPASIGPAIGGIEHCKHGAALRALANLTRPGQELGLAAPEPVHGDQDELPIERLDDLRAFERHRVV